ncbi:MAG: MazG nucleotide pyrophosphohydrolase domain-containing protein [Planctomycetota bacterium]
MTLEELQTLIRDRYYATDSARGTPGTFMHFMEEVGELSTALYDNNRPPEPDGSARPPTPVERANLEEEFADVLAWLATLANINGVSLTEVMHKYTEPGRVEGTKA